MPIERRANPSATDHPARRGRPSVHATEAGGRDQQLTAFTTRARRRIGQFHADQTAERFICRQATCGRVVGQPRVPHRGTGVIAQQQRDHWALWHCRSMRNPRCPAAQRKPCLERAEMAPDTIARVRRRPSTRVAARDVARYQVAVPGQRLVALATTRSAPVKGLLAERVGVVLSTTRVAPPPRQISPTGVGRPRRASGSPASPPALLRAGSGIADLVVSASITANPAGKLLRRIAAPGSSRRPV